MRKLPQAVAVILTLSWEAGAAENDCEPLEPRASEDLSEHFKGEIEGEITGLVGRLAGAGASIDGEYQRLSTDTLRNYDDNHRLYVWQRILYLACIQPELQIDLNTLLNKYLSGPPDEVRRDSQRLRRLYEDALEHLYATLLGKNDLVLSALLRFQEEPSEKNWSHVVQIVDRELEQLDAAIAASLKYDASILSRISQDSKNLRQTVSITRSRFGTLRGILGGKHDALVDMQNITFPTPSEAEDWYYRLQGYLEDIENEILIIISQLSAESRQ